jgi:hypothetical protein
MIRPRFLDSESRRDLIELARDGSGAHRLARRANALVLLEAKAIERDVPPLPRVAESALGEPSLIQEPTASLPAEAAGQFVVRLPTWANRLFPESGGRVIPGLDAILVV